MGVLGVRFRSRRHPDVVPKQYLKEASRGGLAIVRILTRRWMTTCPGGSRVRPRFASEFASFVKKNGHRFRMCYANTRQNPVETPAGSALASKPG